MKRVAVIGAGEMGKNHVRVYEEMPDVELVAVADQNEATLTNIRKLHNVPVYTDYRQMVEQARPEAVSVVVPTIAHHDVACYLLEQGCHVLVEKPIAASLTEAERLIATAKRAKRVLMVGHIERFNPAVVALKQHLQRGELGRVFQIHARRLGPFPTRVQDVGVIMDLATHDLDIMRFLTGSEAIRLFAETSREVHSNFEDMLDGVIRFSNGVVGVLEINWLTPTKIRELYVTGEGGLFRVDYLTQDLYFYENAAASGDKWSTLNLLRGVSEGMMVKYPIRKKEPLRAELESFIGEVQSGGTNAASGADGLAALTLAIGMIESSTSGQSKTMSSHVESPETTYDRDRPASRETFRLPAWIPPAEDLSSGKTHL